MTFYFVPGIILDHFGYQKSIFRYSKLKIVRFVGKLVSDQKIDFLFNKSISRFKTKPKTTLNNIEKPGKMRIRIFNQSEILISCGGYCLNT